MRHAGLDVAQRHRHVHHAGDVPQPRTTIDEIGRSAPTSGHVAPTPVSHFSKSMS